MKKNFKLPSTHVLFLKSLPESLTDSNGVTWPTSGAFTYPNTEVTRNALGLLWGSGDSANIIRKDHSKWLVLSVSKEESVKNTPTCDLLFCGERDKAVSIIQQFAPIGYSPIFGVVIAGMYGTATTGNYGTSIAGYRGVAKTGDYGSATSGFCGASISGRTGTSMTGEGGTATSGDYGNSISSFRGTSVTGNRGTAMSGARGVSIGGYGAKVASGYAGVISLVFQYNNTGLYERRIALVDGVNILPDKYYTLDSDGNFIIQNLTLSNEPTTQP